MAIKKDLRSLKKIYQKRGPLFMVKKVFLVFYYRTLHKIIILWRGIGFNYLIKDLKYVLWFRKNNNDSLELDGKRKRPLISVILPVYNVEPKWLKLCISSVFSQTYPNWELCIYDDASTNMKTLEYLKQIDSRADKRVKIKYGAKNQHISGATNSAISFSTGDYIVLLDNDDELTKNALAECVNVIMANKAVDLIYSDEDRINMLGIPSKPFFKPDWSPETLLSVNYITHLACIKRTIGEKVGWMRKGYEGSQDFDLFLRITERTNNVFHIPKILYHWRMLPTSTSGDINSKKYCTNSGVEALKDYAKRNGINAMVTPGLNKTEYNFRYLLNSRPKISIVIPFKDDVRTLKKCVNSVLSKSYYENYEVILISNNSVKKETETYLNTIKKNRKVRVFYFNKPFNYSKICNYGAKKAKGEILLFLNNDTKVITGGWLEDMAGYATQKNIGLVGAKLLFPDKTIQHDGVVVGIGGFADHVFSKDGENNFRYFGKDTWSRNFLSVTGACMMVERAKFDMIGGFNEDFVICGSDVELGLRFYQKGYRNVVLSFVKLYHFEAKTRKGAVDPVDIEMSLKFYRKYLENGDPYYNQNLTLKDSSGNKLRS